MNIRRGIRHMRREGMWSFLARLSDRLLWAAKVALVRLRSHGRNRPHLLQVDAVEIRSGLPPHTERVDIVIWVHGAPDDVRQCLDSILRFSTRPYSLILVDDGGAVSTQRYLSDFAAPNEATLIRNEMAAGYARAANQGLRTTTGEFIVLLDSDAIVAPGWLDNMLACVKSDPAIGIAGPLSNTASWQSIPDIESDAGLPADKLPAGITPARISELVDKYSGKIFPTVPFLDGLCLCIRKQVIAQLGYFDAENFGPGYGEVYEYCLRARQAGWKLALADQTYIFRAQSENNSSREERQLSSKSRRTLVQKQDPRGIDQGEEFCLSDPILEGIRARSHVMFQREGFIEVGKRQYAGKRVLFILPIQEPSGGGNVVIREARAMRAMGVEASLLNLTGHQTGFSQIYPDLDLPVIYVEVDDIGPATSEFDAVVATFNPSVSWMVDGARANPKTVFGYYIQDFEPHFYPVDSKGYRKAWDSYTLIPNLRRIAKTDWTRTEVLRKIGVESQVVGPSFDLDLFRPRERRHPEWSDRPLRVAAMIRPSAPHRAPKETMETLRMASRQFGNAIEIVLFGASPADPVFFSLPRDFSWNLAGVLSPGQAARLLSDVDIFVDFSTYQAMGLTALEAMACGVAVVLPVTGGTTEFARHEENSLVIETTSADARWEALKRLIEDGEIRRSLQHRALMDACQYYPEGPAFRIMGALFSRQD